MNSVQPISQMLPQKVGSQQNLAKILNNKAILKKMGEGIHRHLKPENLVKMAIMAATNSPKLLECTGNSIMMCLIQSGQLGLDCSGALGDAYMVPYGQTAQFHIGYRGLIKRAHRGGAVKSIQTQVVWNDEEFEYAAGLDLIPWHVPDFDARRDNSIKGLYEMRAFYCVVDLGNGAKHVEVMELEEIEQIRGLSKAAGSSFSPWNDHYVEMGEKTVLRRAFEELREAGIIQPAGSGSMKIQKKELTIE